MATSGLMLVLIVIGSIVRTTGSGLACPDWPLCHGRLIPPFQFNVMVEWTHRLVAALVSVLLVGTVGWTLFHRDTRTRLGLLAGLMVLLLAAQVVLGALTVWKLLDPGVVGGHLAVALLLFATLLTFSLIAEREAEPAGAVAPRPAGLLPLLGVATVATYVQCVLGGIVSTHHAGLACPDWPTCLGEWFPRMEGLVGLHMAHRFGAYALTAVMLAVAMRVRGAADAAVRSSGPMLLTLVVAQVVLGVSNVYLGTPWWLSAAHLGVATSVLALVLTVTFRVAGLPAVARVTGPAGLVGSEP